MARATTGLAYPERFYAAASYAGFDGSAIDVSSKFKNDVALLLYGLFQQATLGSCNAPKPSAWSPVEQSKWKSWNGLGDLASTEAMHLFVKILEEEEPGWYSKVSDSVSEPVVDTEMNHNPKVAEVTENGNISPETKAIENGNISPEPKAIASEDLGIVETQDKDVISQGLSSVEVYDQWIAPPVSGQIPKPRYEHGAAVIQDNMYIFGGNHNGRYFNDIQVLDLKSWTWSKVDIKAELEAQVSPSPAVLPCAGHSLIPWDNKLLSVAGHTKDPSETIEVKAFDLQTYTWSVLKTYGQPPVSRGGHSVSLVDNSLVIFGGQDANRKLLNDVQLLDLETMTWDDIYPGGAPPAPRFDHASAVYAERYLLIFGGGSHSTCFNDLHILDLQAMEWSRPVQQGDIPKPRAGHAGVTIGENWFIVGGGDNNSGASDTIVLNMSKHVWSVVTSVHGRVPVVSEGLSLVASSYHGEDVLVSFGGYNGRYNNEVHVLKPSHKSTQSSKLTGPPVLSSISAVHNATNSARDELELDGGQDNVRQIIVDNVDAKKTKVESVAALKTAKEEMESALSQEKLRSQQLKQELAEAETRNSDLYKELQSVRGQLAAEQSRCFKLEVSVAELQQKLQTMEALREELEHLQRGASERAALDDKQRQSSSGVWGWLAGTSPHPDEA